MINDIKIVNFLGNPIVGLIYAIVIISLIFLGVYYLFGEMNQVWRILLASFFTLLAGCFVSVSFMIMHRLRMALTAPAIRVQNIQDIQGLITPSGSESSEGSESSQNSRRD